MTDLTRSRLDRAERLVEDARRALIRRVESGAREHARLYPQAWWLR